MTAKRVRIREVAARAGVSVGTVSNVLNHPEAVSDRTREHILGVMAQMNFVRDASARQLRVGKSQTVGVVVRDLSNPFYMELARGIEDRLAQDGYLMMVSSSDEDPARESRFVRLFAEQGVRGMLITPFHNTSEQIGLLKALQIPVVLMDSISDEAKSVSVDHIDGAKQAITHLLEQGHRRIGYIAGPMSIRPCWERTEGARQAITEYGLNVDEVLVTTILDVLSADAGQAGMAALLNQGPITGIFCVNDFVAMGALRELRNRGLIVPADIAVIGYDDIVFAREMTVPLTSVRQPMHQLGGTAVEMLLNPTQGTDHISFQPQLIKRESSLLTRY
ncbi:MAG: LacI family transcriptional regulator [Propionibacteriaceae bacterium]|jgi:LacI family transcriptional regulator|nr:LacI family transcriptional regulator [Propionibacteriaceae bacterium]